MRLVSDSDTVRRQNRRLVLASLRAAGPLTRTQLTAETGLSSASITAITQDMLAQDLLSELPEPTVPESKPRGRPAIRLHFNRHAAAACLIEIDLNRLRLSLVDYAGTLIDRLEIPTPGQGAEWQDAKILADQIAQLCRRNPVEAQVLRRVAISVQGILDRDGASLLWSPIAGLAGRATSAELAHRLGVPVTLSKRGPLLADGTRWLDPSLRTASLVTIFLGSTVAMGMSSPTASFGRGGTGATEFGHMNHMPGGALCRCGMRGCIEAYAADYGVLRSAFSVPETTPPAARVPEAEYDDLIRRARQGDRHATHAFNLAGRALGYGISRMLALADASHVIIVGPGARALDLMKPEIDAALSASFVCRISGTPEVRALRDESEPIFAGLMMQSLQDLDWTEFAPMPAVGARA